MCCIFQLYEDLSSFFQKIYCSVHKSQRGATLEKFFAIFLFLYIYAEIVDLHQCTREIEEGQKKNGQSKRGEGEEKDIQIEIWGGS